MVDRAGNVLGGLDVLVNNAGVLHRYTRSPRCRTSEWQAGLAARPWASTSFGPANVTWCVVQHMVSEKRAGRIVNVLLPRRVPRGAGPPGHGASKAGLNAFGQSLAIASRSDGITVATVAPGFVDTDMASTHLALAPAETRSARRARFSASPSPRRSPPRCCTWHRHRPEWASGAILDLNGASYLRS